VFVRTKRGADRLVKRLGTLGVEAVAMHGDKSQRQRERALANFQSGEVDTLVATDVAARGIDVARISHVINFDPPEDGDTYVHRVGRTARAGRPGIGITLVGREQRRDMTLLAQRLGIDHGLGGGVAVSNGHISTARGHRPRPQSGSGGRRAVTRSYGQRRGGR
jgi:superfamily II DNA/RNA helicase